MKGEDEPISPDEFLLRLIWRDFFRDGTVPTILSRAFLPKPKEFDGISVFREVCLVQAEDVLTVVAEEKRERYGIARLAVSELLKLDLTVVGSKIEELPGHAVLPELNVDAIAHDAKKCSDWQQTLADLASRNVIRKPTKSG